MHSRRHRSIAAACLALVAGATRGAAAPPLPAATGDAWIEVRTPSFVTLTNAGERKGREVALGFERFRAALQMMRPSGVAPSPVPTRILVFRDDRSFEPYKPGSEERRALLLGLFQASSLANYILVNGYPARDSAMPIVYHEYAHSVAHASFGGRLPLWLDEGLAEFYSTFEVERGELLVGKPVAHHVRTLRETSFVPLERLFAVDRDSPEYQEAERIGTFYAESWLVVSYLMLGGPDRLQQTRGFLAGVAEGRPPEEAFRAAFGHGFDRLEKDLRGYVNARTFPFLRVPQAQVGPEPEVSVRPLPRGDVLYELGSALALRSEADAGARAHLDAAAAAGVGDAWAMLGFLDERAGRADAAQGLFRKAAAAGASRPVSQLVIARGLLEAPGARAEAALLARQLLERAVVAEPDYAEARAVLGKTWLLTEGDPSPGLAHLNNAYARLPGRADIAYDIAMLELRAGRTARAEELVRTVVVPLGDPGLASHARAAVERSKVTATVNDALASGDPARATAALESALAVATDPTLRAELEEHLRSARVLQAKNAQIDRFNAAIAVANAGKLTQARKDLRALRAEVDDPSLQKSIDDVLEKLDEAFRRRP